MENGIYLGLSRQLVLRDNMDIIANNIANMNTSGYRAQNLLFEEYLEKERKDFDPMSFVNDRGQYDDTAPGTMASTENPLDIALAGPGFIGVLGPGGTVAYSRAGNMQLDAGGTLLNAAGFPISSAGGGVITLPQGSTEIKIDEKGVVSNQNGPVGQIMVAEFENLQELRPIGDTLYRTDAAPLPPDNTRIRQGQLEGSNVKPVLEMTRMIETLRSYQSMQNVMQTENERLRGAIQKLTRQS